MSLESVLDSLLAWFLSLPSWLQLLFIMSAMAVFVILCQESQES
jgi:hypothetical protein